MLSSGDRRLVLLQRLSPSPCCSSSLLLSPFSLLRRLLRLGGSPILRFALLSHRADVFDFTLRFDALRMERPFLPNDFSYYRRLLPKFNKHPGVKIKDDEASGMALFTAEHIPMMTTLARACAKWDANDARSAHVMEALALMANSCMKMIKTKKFTKPATLLFCARAMTGSIVLYDHISPMGVFAKKSPISIKQVIQVLKKDFPGNDGIILLNAIQFSTKHYKEASDATKEMFEDDA